jgi:hypothetical protein
MKCPECGDEHLYIKLPSTGNGLLVCQACKFEREVTRLGLSVKSGEIIRVEDIDGNILDLTVLKSGMINRVGRTGKVMPEEGDENL